MSKTPDPIHITEKAGEAIRKRMAEAPAGTAGLRLRVKATGCSGNSYVMEYADSEGIAADDRFEHGGAVLFIPKTQSWMLFGMTVDYGADELGNEKFLFSNPNESGRCGCGESFQVTPPAHES